MSGGSFDYVYYRVSEFADQLDEKLSEKDDSMTDEVRKEMVAISNKAHLLWKEMKEVEWYYSGDTGNESFLERLKSIREHNERTQTI